MSGAGRTYLVTGAAGFVGANMCRRLLETGSAVHAVVAPRTDLWRLAGIEDALHLHRADICDAEKLGAAVRAIRPAVIYHFATYGAYPQQTDAERILLTNIFGFWNLLRACNEVGFELFVNTGSSSEYGKKRGPMRETDRLEPDSYYAVAKSGQTLLGQHMARQDGLRVVTLRPFSVYGPWEAPSRLIPHLMMAAIRDRPIRMVSPATARDFIHVDDFLDACLLIDELKALNGEIFNVGTGTQTTLETLVATLSELCGAPLDARWEAMPARTWDTDRWVADVGKLSKRTAWRPATPLREGLEKCLAWFRAHSDLYGEIPA